DVKPCLHDTHRAHRDLHSFPTRRSSDLGRRRKSAPSRRASTRVVCASPSPGRWRPTQTPTRPTRRGPARAWTRRTGSTSVWRPRSEEHTSELQSLAYLVCRLLLEKKKKN